MQHRAKHAIPQSDDERKAPLSRRNERLIWAAGVVMTAVATGGIAYAVAVPGSYNCLKTEQETGFTLVCTEQAPGPSASPSASASASPTASPTGSPSPSPSASPTVSPTASPSPSPTPSPTVSPTPSPSPSPTPSPTGPAGWPGPGNTGVPQGTVVTDYTGPCTITVPNTVIDAKNVNCGPLQIRTTGVRITRSNLNGGVDTGNDNAANQVTKVTIDQSRIKGQSGWHAVRGSAFVVTRSHITGDHSGGWCWRSCTVEDSYIETAGSHTSAFRMQRDGVLRHNTLWCNRGVSDTDGGCSGDVVSYPDVISGQQTVIDNNVMVNNLFKATPGWFCFRAGNGTRWTVTGNTFERGAGSCSLQPGGRAVDSWNASGVGNTFTGNVYSNGGAVTP